MRTLDDLSPRGQRVLVRSDLNVPIATGPDGAAVVTDDSRVVASAPTLARLSAAGARVIVMAHLGRPAGSPDPAYSLRPAAERLAEVLGRPVVLADDVCGPSARAAVSSMADGDIVMLENVRFDPRETSDDPARRAELAAELARLGDVFVSDGFGVVHREQASVTGVARILPSYAGDLVVGEVRAFATVLREPQRPYAVVLGGSKVSDKLAVIANLLPRVDRLLIGGGMCFTFLAAQGHAVGRSLLEADQVPTVRGFIDEAAERGVRLLLPVDVVVASEITDEARTRVVGVDAIGDDDIGLDIGPATVQAFRAALSDARTVVWNGPMGVFERTPFAAGTREVARAVAAVDGTSVVGGGDSAAAVHLLGVPAGDFTHISTGGGASLELLEGKVLPGIAVLEED